MRNWLQNILQIIEVMVSSKILEKLNFLNRQNSFKNLFFKFLKTQKIGFLIRQNKKKWTIQLDKIPQII